MGEFPVKQKDLLSTFPRLVHGIGSNLKFTFESSLTHSSHMV